MQTKNDVPADYGQIGYVVATDSFLSGWGEAPGRSLYAVAVRTTEEMGDVEWRMGQRSDFKRVRFNMHLPRLREGDHLHVVPAEQFRYQPSAGNV